MQPKVYHNQGLKTHVGTILGSHAVISYNKAHQFKVVVIPTPKKMWRGYPKAFVGVVHHFAMF